ncbi:hypothetical protein Fmac_024696 [Flemingia macrophylla]|uniref:Uncharacterized protein n=1 Tax=Flemingia macrophylla TaxID=520843 RepID=A0ABD1LQN1_9FABA
MGLEDNSIEFCLQVSESDCYVRNLEDYVDAAEYKALLQTLGESDSEGRKEAPLASKSVVQGLPTVKIESEGAVCTSAVAIEIETLMVKRERRKKKEERRKKEEDRRKNEKE